MCGSPATTGQVSETGDLKQINIDFRRFTFSNERVLHLIPHSLFDLHLQRLLLVHKPEGGKRHLSFLLLFTLLEQREFIWCEINTDTVSYLWEKGKKKVTFFQKDTD